MKFSYGSSNRSEEETLKQLEEDQQQEIEDLVKKGVIPQYQHQTTPNIGNGNGNGKSNQNKKHRSNTEEITKLQTNNNNIKNNLTFGNEVEILNKIEKLRRENTDLTFEQWSSILLEKRIKFNDKVSEYFPDMPLLSDFELSIKTILNIADITLPFMGLVFAVPSSLKTQFFELLRKLGYSYYSDKFTARAFVSHSATLANDKLHEIDMLPMIKDKILITPELSPLFTGKDDDIKEQFGIITRILDGKGLETNSGVHGKRGYSGNYMFTWLGAAVDIPYSVYKFLSTIGFKIYFLRLPRTEVSTDDLVEQLTSKKKFSEKMEEIEKFLIDYLTWFEVCPIAIGQNRAVKIEWDNDKDNLDTIKIIAELAQLLAHIRGHVIVYKSSEHEELIPIENNLNKATSTKETINNSINTSNNTNSIYSDGFSHRLPIIENPSRAAQQLYNLARGHALSYGRNYITKDEVLLVIKVVLSTGSIERVLILDLLIANKGTLTTSQITKSMRISNDTAKRTMTEFKGLELATMERVGDSSNSEHKITLNPKFNWFLTDEFAELRNGFKPTNYKDQLKSETFAASKNTPVPTEQKQQQEQGRISNVTDDESSNTTTNDYSHRGEIPRSKKITEIADNNIQGNNFTTLPSIEKEKFNNQLISESDLSIDGPYDPEIINNINRLYPNSDRWFCNNCTMRGDKWFMMKHPCKNNINNKGGSKLI
jgi:hypothetical protein